MASSASLSANKLAVMPTSLDEGRGEVVVPEPVVAFCLKRHLDGWTGGGMSKRVSEPNVGICQMQKGGKVPFWEGARNGGMQHCRQP